MPQERGARIIASRPPQQPLQLGRVQPVTANRHRIEQQHRYFQAIAPLQLSIGIHIDDGKLGQ